MTCFISLFLIFQSCKSTNGTQQDDQESYDQEDDQEEYKSVSNSKIDDSFPHPRSAKAWETNILMLSSTTPPREEINSCILESLALVENATNDFAIKKAKENLLTSVEEKEELYHWCFYSMMNALDIKLDHVGLTNDKRKDLFFKRMQGLWILARALDDAREVKIYFKYLRSRYMGISHQYFGRNLEVVNAPFSGYKTQIKKTSTNKAAGEADVD